MNLSREALSAETRADAPHQISQFGRANAVQITVIKQRQNGGSYPHITANRLLSVGR